MNQKDEITDWDFFKEKAKEHWMILTAAIAVLVVALVGAVLVFLWFINTSDIGAQGTATFNEWTVGWIWGFCLMLFVWQLLFVILPTIGVLGLGGYLWWKKLPEEEKQEIKNRETSEREKSKRARNVGAGGGGMFIIYSIYIYFTGDFGTQFGTQPYTYWVYAYFWAIIWMVIIIGIPAAVILIIVYLKVWRKTPEAKTPEVKEPAKVEPEVEE